ncbi:MAG: hypothetical protein OIF58_15550, partial [Cohaesibacter sp.]|nr:hypothetical protein [Cohaesibacter sp.]
SLIWEQWIKSLSVDMYTYQLSCLRRESHACESKPLIPHQITPANQFLTPDSQMKALVEKGRK